VAEKAAAAAAGAPNPAAPRDKDRKRPHDPRDGMHRESKRPHVDPEATSSNRTDRDRGGDPEVKGKPGG